MKDLSFDIVVGACLAVAREALKVTQARFGLVRQFGAEIGLRVKVGLTQ